MPDAHSEHDSPSASRWFDALLLGAAAADDLPDDERLLREFRKRLADRLKRTGAGRVELGDNGRIIVLPPPGADPSMPPADPDPRALFERLREVLADIHPAKVVAKFAPMPPPPQTKPVEEVQTNTRGRLDRWFGWLKATPARQVPAAEQPVPAVDTWLPDHERHLRQQFARLQEAINEASVNRREFLGGVRQWLAAERMRGEPRAALSVTIPHGRSARLLINGRSIAVSAEAGTAQVEDFSNPDTVATLRIRCGSRVSLGEWISPLMGAIADVTANATSIHRQEGSPFGVLQCVEYDALHCAVTWAHSEQGQSLSSDHSDLL